MEKVAFGAAVAAVALVIAIVLRLRHKTEVEVSGIRIAATPDFQNLSAVAKRVDDVGECARTIVQKEQEPWKFTISEGLQKIVDVNQKRRLLFALCQNDSTINVLQPKTGEPYQPLEMSASSECSGTCRWVVSADVAHDSAGFKQREKVLLPANVEVCTVDWWLLVSKDPECLIGNEIRANAEDYTGQNEEYVSTWQAVDGFDVFVDLREVFDEERIYKWSKRYAKEIAEAYPSNPERHLVQLGVVGEEYDLSVMRTDGEEPVGTARVVKVVERDGHSQYGLGCPHQPPLLYAIVQVEEV